MEGFRVGKKPVLRKYAITLFVLSTTMRPRSKPRSKRFRGRLTNSGFERVQASISMIVQSFGTTRMLF